MPVALHVAEQVDDVPDAVALGGWRVDGGDGHKTVGAGYHGLALHGREPG